VLGVPIAAGVRYPVFGILLSPMIAAAAMSFRSVSVIASAPRPSFQASFASKVIARSNRAENVP
jgi:cation transport ATPase